ncbi:hypothetical protein Y032_0016g3050 [Ancylostoma ceylanicum]|uniref:Uncharacterized protein n=1 Tax=Ancylostoma ceylanicum TaxID=53326 RepID=A0A016V6B0_9BILA|nr:hypothetical protein Y032_0016g3050 [Ancylostoma ceylanicum]
MLLYPMNRKQVATDVIHCIEFEGACGFEEYKRAARSRRGVLLDCLPLSASTVIVAPKKSLPHAAPPVC